jgi:DNA polymerase sigma
MREIEPSEASSRQRQEVVDKITEVCSSLWDGSSVDTYGSFATGLYLPHSDTDVLVTVPSGGNARNARNLLNLLATHLARESWCRCGAPCLLPRPSSFFQIRQRHGEPQCGTRVPHTLVVK